MLTLTVIRHNGQPPRHPLAASFDLAGGTIGRAVTNRLVLDDAERTVSRLHVQIVWRDGRFSLIDRGSNPALVNGAPLDPGQEVPLANGDEVQIGGYQLRADVSVDDDTVTNGEPPANAHADDPFAGLFDAAPSPSSPLSPAPPSSEAEDTFDDLLGPPPHQPAPAVHTSADDFDFGFDDPESKRSIDELFGLDSAKEVRGASPLLDPLVDPLTQPNTAHDADPFASLTGNARPAVPAATQADAGSELHAAFTPPRARAVAQPAPAPTPTPTSANNGEQTLIDAFLRGLSAPNVRLEALTPELMQLVGELLREATQGTLDLLAARAALKREMRTGATMIAAADNNPLKFSPNADAALAHLLNPPMRGFMPPAAALDDAYTDLRAHQVGVVAGMRAALDGVFERFEPRHIEARLSGRSLLDGLLPGINRRARCWDLFADMYGQLSREAAEDFQTLFGRAFVAAYEAQIDELKRRSRA
ncbi:type VI secretion system-associated FHA domain protein TagH [Caballeronia sp. TF1N1]|uniref:type VI secretion system-associated FHA domain protein TagH n=1 Tax=Caballeronia sp. TF1N1 TaxID=2878153 RepID=UPI001FD32C66|nr:type VI secretion system-associated FHA domain protein TagH [Caballeronia sp. TF1N1]